MSLLANFIKYELFSSLNGSVRRRKSGRKGSEISEKAVPVNTKSKLIDSEDAATGGVGLGVYLRYFQSLGMTLFIASIFCNAIQQGASVYSSSKKTRF